MNELTDQQISTIKDAASKLTGSKRRAFQAQVALDYLDGSPRRAERVFGWWRDAVELGLNELRTGITCLDNTSARGNRKTEEKQPALEQDIRSLAEPQSQQDPKFQSPFTYTRMTDLDNGPENSSFRTQFMNRMVEFADRNNLEIVLVYYPPYHSKYNPIERCWGILEEHWNGTLLNTRETVLEWARTMTWKGVHPIVELLDRVYEKGIRIAKKAFRQIEKRLKRDEEIPKYSVMIQPQLG